MLSSLCGLLWSLQASLIRGTYTQSYKVCCDHLYKLAARKKSFKTAVEFWLASLSNVP